MIFGVWEIIQILITILAIGFIFSAPLRRPRADELDLADYKNNFWGDIKFGVAAAAPAVILHEFSHKFLALGYGFDAVYNASFWGLGIGIFLKMLAPGFLFFIPGYVAISGI